MAPVEATPVRAWEVPPRRVGLSAPPPDVSSCRDAGSQPFLRCLWDLASLRREGCSLCAWVRSPCRSVFVADGEGDQGGRALRGPVGEPGRSGAQAGQTAGPVHSTSD